MGTVTAGIPQNIVIELARQNDCTAFVETGTFKGNTSRWAAQHFEVVHTIEKAEVLFSAYSPGLSTIKGVTPHLGDSRAALPRIVESLGKKRAVFWLDGHWSGGDTAGESDECPLMGELECLLGRSDDIILIDDARCFLCAPPFPHNAEQWPTISEIVQLLHEQANPPFVQVLDDVIFVVPNREDVRSRLVKYAQTRSTQQGAGLAVAGLGRRVLKSRLVNYVLRSLRGR